MSNHRTPLVAALCAGAAALGLAACGGDDSANAGDDGPPTAQEARAAAVKFARCMREQGIDMPDPKVGEGGEMAIQVRGRPGMSRAKMEAADKACRKHLPKGGKPPSEEEQAEFRKEALEFSRCMREHGVDMPDPQFQEGGKVTMRGGPGEDPSMNPESPTFRKAAEACSEGRDGLGFGAGGGGEK